MKTSTAKCNCDYLPSGGMEWNPKCPLHGKRGTHSQKRVKLTGTARFKADEARQRRKGGTYYGWPHKVTRGSKRVKFDFQPPFASRT